MEVQHPTTPPVRSAVLAPPPLRIAEPNPQAPQGGAPPATPPAGGVLPDPIDTDNNGIAEDEGPPSNASAFNYDPPTPVGSVASTQAVRAETPVSPIAMSSAPQRTVAHVLGFNGKGKGKCLRHRKVKRPPLEGITKGDLRRLARRGGVKRMGGDCAEEVRGVLKEYLTKIIRDSVTYTEFAQRKTVTAMDVVHALKRHGQTLYGFGN